MQRTHHDPAERCLVGVLLLIEQSTQHDPLLSKDRRQKNTRLVEVSHVKFHLDDLSLLIRGQRHPLVVRGAEPDTDGRPIVKLRGPRQTRAGGNRYVHVNCASLVVEASLKPKP